MKVHGITMTPDGQRTTPPTVQTNTVDHEQVREQYAQIFTVDENNIERRCSANIVQCCQQYCSTLFQQYCSALLHLIAG